LSIISILAVAGVLHVLIRSWRQLEADQVIIADRAGALERANRELRLRETDIASQNEELQSQTEELERQSEELRVANDELGQREHTLETLLALSRSLGMDITPGETMNRICETLGQLVNGPSTATAILMREGDEFAVRCHYGFGPEGIRQERIPASESFAQLVSEERRTGYLEDVALRPDLKVPQPVNGEPVVAVLASPLIVRGRPVGTVEIYARQKKSWSDEQVALAESLAAQAAISEIALAGVRMSWLAAARKRVLRTDASSASRRRRSSSRWSVFCTVMSAQATTPPRILPSVPRIAAALARMNRCRPLGKISSSSSPSTCSPACTARMIGCCGGVMRSPSR
jgi:transcriptional regulator with GAF, ATPase, and Fis domain